MAAYHKVEVSLNTNAVEVGIPSPQTVNVVVPTIGPAGPVGSVGPVGPQGPQGVPGTGLEVLTTQGDILYQGASTGQRLPIGTSGQILKVAASGIPEWGAAPASGVSSVNGETGAVTITAASIDAANANHSHQPADVFADAAKVTSSSAIFAGIYFRNGDDNGKGLYEDPDSRNYFWWDSDLSKWFLANAADASRFESSSNTLFPWQATGWTPISPQTGTLTVAQANLYEASGASANESLLRTPKSGNATSGQLVLGSDSRLSDSRTPSSTLAHAASHSAGAKAFFLGTVGGAPDTFSIIADNVGAAGNSISFSFNGSTDIDSAVNAWNAANPSNTASVISLSGDGTQVPSNGQTITLSGGVNLGSDPIVSPVFEKVTIANDDEDVSVLSLTKLTQNIIEFATQELSINHTGGNDTPYISVSDGTDEALLGLRQGEMFLQGSNPNVRIEQNGGALANILMASAKLVDDLGFDEQGPYTATIDVQEQLTDNVTLTIPDQSGTLAVVTDIPTTAGDVGAVAAGAITTSGLTQATARLIGRTSSGTGAVEEIQIGTGLSLSAGELSATGGSGGGEVRSDFVSPYTYTGLADAGTSESTANWTIRRSEYNSAGTYVATLTASAVQWANRLTASYA
jgi:hypothetical protein